jgi:hypothetical protein
MLPFVAELPSSLPGASCDPAVVGDSAVIELFTREASAFRQTIGAFSRIGAHHPGPAPFYFFAPLYIALGGTHGALCLSALGLSAAWTLLILVAIRIGSGWGGLFRTAGVIACVIAYTGWQCHRSVWNPNMGLLPLVGFVVCAIACARGAHALLPLAALAGSFAVQCHIMYAPVVLGTLAWVIVGVSRRALGRRSDAKAARLALIVTGVVTAVMWLPSAIDLALSRGRNLRLVAAATADHAGGQSAGGVGLVDAITVVLRWLSANLAAPAGFRLGDAPSSGLFVIAGVVVVGVSIALATIPALRSNSGVWPLGGALAVLAGSVLAVMSLGTNGEPYLYRWLSAVGAGLLIAALSARSLPKRADRIVAVISCTVAVVLTGMAVRDSLRSPPLCSFITARWSSESLQTATDATLTDLAQLQPTTTRVVWRSNDDWGTAAGVVLAGTKRGIDLRVSGPGGWILGDQFSASGHEDAVISIERCPDRSELQSNPSDPHMLEIQGHCARLASHSMDQAWEPTSVSAGSVDSDLVFLSGWAAPERAPDGDFRWMTGTEGSLVIPIQETGYHLTIELAPFSVRGRDQVVSFVVAGREIATRVLDRNDWTAVDLSVPPGREESYGPLTIQATYAESPATARGSADRRRLSLRVRRLDVTSR